MVGQKCTYWMLTSVNHEYIMILGDTQMRFCFSDIPFLFSLYVTRPLRKQGMWEQTTLCLSKGHISVLEQNIFFL